MSAEEGLEDKHREEIQDGPGRRLRALRQSRELSLPRVAVMLHLDEAKLEAIEADDFDHLPDAVFVQGYLKNYARLLDTPVEPIMEAYRRARPDTRKPSLQVVRMKHEVKSSHFVVRLMTWLIVLGLITLLTIWWRGYLTWPVGSVEEGGDRSSEMAVGETPSPQEFTPPAEEPAQLPTESGTMMLPSASTDSEEPSEQAGSDDSGEQSTTSSTELPAADTAQESGSEQSPALEIEPSVVSVVRPQPAPVSEANNGSAGDTRIVEIEFLDACWTDIRDSSGRFRIQGVLEKGARRRLDGEPPFRVVLGNAGAVKMWIDGAEFDLTPHVRANVARFDLDPDRM